MNCTSAVARMRNTPFNGGGAVALSDAVFHFAALSLVGDDVLQVLTLEGSINSRKHRGGTAPGQVRLSIGRARERLAQV